MIDGKKEVEVFDEEKFRLVFCVSNRFFVFALYTVRSLCFFFYLFLCGLAEIYFVYIQGARESAIRVFFQSKVIVAGGRV